MIVSPVNVYIEYNPFTVKTNIVIDNEPVPDSSLVYMLTNTARLQHWIDRIFPELFKELNTEAISLTFEGTELDGQDVKDAVNLYRSKHPNHKIYNEDCDYILHKINTEERIETIKNLFEEAKSGSIEAFRSLEVQRRFDKAMSPEFEVTVLATMSAGKSTVINAMVGWELLPSKNAACTAAIARIINDDSMNIFEARRYSKKDNDSYKVYLSDDWQPLELADGLKRLECWNSDPLTHTIEIKGDIPNIDERKGIQMVMVDTPGPNNSNDVSHGRVTRDAIGNNQPSLVLYILNATQLGIEDDKDLLNLIKKEMEKGGREAQDRFIFIVNKIDMIDPEKEPLVDVVQNIKDYLHKNGIHNPLVVLMSAELAKMIRIKRNGGELTKKQERELKNLVSQFVDLEEFNLLKTMQPILDSDTFKTLNYQLDSYREKGETEKVAELLSGVPILEALLDNYLNKHAIPAKIKDAVDVFHRVAQDNDVLVKLKNVLSLEQKELTKITSQLQALQNDEERIIRAKDFRDNVKKKAFSITKETKDARKNIDLKINALFDNIQNEISESIYFPFIDIFQNDSKKKTKTKKETLIPKSLAEEKLSKLEKEIRNLIDDIEDVLNEDLKKFVEQDINKTLKDYKNYVADLLSSIPNFEHMESIKELQAENLKMPSTKVLLEEHAKTISTKVYAGEERYGFLWLFKRKVYKTIYTEEVNMESVFKDIELSLRDFKDRRNKEQEEALRVNFERSKELVLLHMDEIDKKMEQTYISLQKISSDESLRKATISEYENKINWLEKMMLELNRKLKLQA
jgi:GTPase SAR1 family protein